MPHTVPHQRIIKIHRERVSSDFLGIKNENWQAASRTLGAHALRLYLYLAANANNYELALSPAAIEAAIGMPRSTYHDQFRKLVNYGYLIPRDGNRYDFYETPHLPKEDNTRDGYDFESQSALVDSKAIAASESPSENTEINKTDNINNVQEKQVFPATIVNQFSF